MAKQASTVRQRQPSKQPTGVAEQQVREACSAVPYPPPGKGSTEYQLPPHRDSEVDSLSAVQATSPDDDADYKYHGLTPAVYYCWQYSGAVLALTSLAGIITDKYEEDDPWVTRRLIAYLLILLVALFAHESRPYKREFNIRWKSWDEVKQRGMDGSVTGLEKAEAEAAAAASAASGAAAPASSKKES